MTFPIPTELAAHSADRGAWIAALPDAVATCAARWSLTLGPPFEPGGQTSWVAPAGPDRVLKVGFPEHWEARDEGDALRAWDGGGAVRVLAEHADDQVTALLLERATPGTPLSGRPERDEVLTGLLRRLWVPPPAGHAFRPLAQLCDAWAAEAASPGSGPAAHLDPGLVRECLALYCALPRDDTPQVLLATDLHAGNVLSASREPWLVIDPKPFVGDPCYDVLQHVLNERARLATDPRGLIARVAGLAGVDADRVAAWLLARCVVEAQWWPHDVAAIARALRS